MKCYLKVILDEIGMTQKELAEKVGVSQQAISNICKSQSIPKLDLAYKISKITGKQIEEIWEFE